MRIVSDGYPYIAVCALLAAALGYFVSPVAAVVPLVLMCYFAYFFRNPDRMVVLDDNLLYSPADGTVMEVKDFYDEEFLNCEAKKVTIFLSVFNVHVNRTPARGEIAYQSYICGGFVPAYKDSAAFENERHAIGMETPHGKLLVIQVAGILARRIVSWTTLGNMHAQGDVYGMIKFGSCTELVVPKDTEILCKKGDKVQGGITVLGRYKA